MPKVPCSVFKKETISNEYEIIKTCLGDLEKQIPNDTKHGIFVLTVYSEPRISTDSANTFC